MGNLSNNILPDPLNVSIGSTVTTFGDLISSNRTDQLAVNFSQTTPEILVDTTVTGSGSVTNAAAQSVVATGTTSTSTAKMNTRRTTFYSPSHEMYAYFTATFSDPTANGEQFIGLFDDDNGFAIGYNGTQFCVRRRDGGTDTDVAQADFNGQLLTDFKRAGTVETLNPQNGNVYRIRFGWLGNAPIEFEILSPDGDWILLHQIKYPNSSTLAHIENPDLPLTSEVSNGADSTNVSIATSSWAAGVVKVPTGTTVIFQKTSTQDGSVPTGGAPTIDSVFNSESNVLDSGWVRTIDYPGGNFINIVGDQTLNVYLMNASTDQGDEIVGDGQPSIQTQANVPATFAAPYFDDYYRVLISNESGSSLTSYSIHNRGHSEVQQALAIGLEQTLLGFFSAAVQRAVLAAKNDAGNYGNILRGDGGGLRTAINEHETDAPIRPANSWSTTRTTVTTTAAVALSSASALANRVSVEIYNADNNTACEIAPTAASINANQYRTLEAGGNMILELDESVDIAARSRSGTLTLEFTEVADTTI